MTEEEFRELCEEIEPGTRLTFTYRDQEVEGKFVGCAEDAVVIEANGRNFLWPKELCDWRKTDYPRPSYS